MNNEIIWLLVVIVALIAISLLLQTIVMVVAFFTVRKTITNVQGDIQELRSTVIPLFVRSKDTLENVAPKIESIAADVADLTRRFREQGAEAQLAAADILDRIHRQTSRVDNMFTTVIDSVEHASIVVSDSVARPVRQVSAMLASVKAFLTVLARGRRSERPAEVVPDQDMFV
jgi:hypothetical protein